MAAVAKQVGGRALSYLRVRRGRPPASYESGHGTTKRYADLRHFLLTLATQEEIARALADSRETVPCIIGVDGFPGAGKSHLARALAMHLQVPCIHADDYVDKRDDVHDYIARIRVSELRRDLLSAIASRHRVLCDAVCAQWVWAAVNIEPRHRIYVKRVSVQGVWNDGIDLENFLEDPESESGQPWLERQVLRYHAKESPHLRADIGFERIEQQ